MISVAMCTYNGEKFIGEQIDSILAQTQSVDEIIICDDCSKDKTVAIAMEKLKISSVNYKIIRNDIRKGVSKNFQYAICNCSGDIIFLCDQDDVWKNTKVELMCNELRRDNEILLAFTDAHLIDEYFSIFKKSLWETIKFKNKENYTVIDFIKKRFVTGATVAFRKNLIKYISPIPDCWIHDAWLAVNAALYGRVIAINEKTIYYRQHSSNTIGLQRETIIVRIKKRWGNLDESWKFRLCMAERVKSFRNLNENKLSEAEKTELERSYKFWIESYLLYNEPYNTVIKSILKNIFNGNYKRYNHGFVGAAVDLCIKLKK